MDRKTIRLCQRNDVDSVQGKDQSKCRRSNESDILRSPHNTILQFFQLDFNSGFRDHLTHVPQDD